MAVLQIRNRIDAPGHDNFSGPGYNIMHVSVPDADMTVANVNLVVDAIRDMYELVKQNYFTSTLIRVGERVARVDVTPNQIIAATPLTVTGTSAANRLPAEVALAVSWRTGLAGPAFRGRTYMGPFTVAAISSGGLINAVTAQGFQDAGNGLIAALDALAFNPFLTVWRRSAQAGQIVTGCVVDTEPDTQRRRGQ